MKRTIKTIIIGSDGYCTVLDDNGAAISEMDGPYKGFINRLTADISLAEKVEIFDQPCLKFDVIN